MKFIKLILGAILAASVVVSAAVPNVQSLHDMLALQRGRALYEQALAKAQQQIVGQDNNNVQAAHTVQNIATAQRSDQLQSTAQPSGDALRFPEVKAQTASEQETQLRKQYGDPVAVHGQEQVFRKDATHFITLLSADAKTFTNDQGQEQQVDTNLVVATSQEGQVLTPRSAPVDVQLPLQVSKQSPITVGTDGKTIALYPESMKYGNARVRDNAVLYNNVQGSDDVQLTVQADGVKEDIVLAKWEGRHTFTYGLDAHAYDVQLQSNQILVYDKQAATNSTAINSTAQRKPLFVIAAPMMVDAAGASSDAITLSLTHNGSNYRIGIDANQTWLSDSQRKYPVKIDPTVIIGKDRILNTVTSSVHGRYEGRSYGYVGYMTACTIGMCGVLGVKDPGMTRMFVQVNYDFRKNIPAEARIDAGTLNMYEYTAPGNMGTQFAAYRLKQYTDIGGATWNSTLNVEREIAGNHAVSAKKIGMHQFDIRETVNGWVQGLYNNYGLMVAATDERSDGGAFYTTYATAGNAGQIGFTPDKAPSITIQWSVPDPVDINYPITDTTVLLRNMMMVERSGKLQFQGVFADGVTAPGATVSYQLSDAGKQYQGQVPASYSYKYPDTSSFIQAFPKGVTQYKDKLSNWQTTVPFTEPEFNTVYTIDALSEKDGTTSGRKSSDSFVVYKVTQYDTLPKIAAYYGVSLDQIAYDNRIQDMLLIKNNTLFIRNPSKNANRLYNPPALNDESKAQVDTLLMGRGLHCEFGFEPINLILVISHFHAQTYPSPISVAILLLSVSIMLSLVE